jgi:hypothetical protein
MRSVIMLNFIMLNVVVLIVVGPLLVLWLKPSSCQKLNKTNLSLTHVFNVDILVSKASASPSLPCSLAHYCICLNNFINAQEVKEAGNP